MKTTGLKNKKREYWKHHMVRTADVPRAVRPWTPSGAAGRPCVPSSALPELVTRGDRHSCYNNNRMV